eukprot:scaffold113650_cov43-Prasinocladus_malaysianus.AAC.1
MLRAAKATWQLAGRVGGLRAPAVSGLSALQGTNTVSDMASEAASLRRWVETTAYDVGDSTNIKWHESMVTRADKESLLDQKGCVLWFTGLSGSGKSTVACTLEHALAQ